MTGGRSRAGQALAAAGRTLAFLALFLGSQTLVSLVCEVAVFLQLMAEGIPDEAAFYEAFLERVRGMTMAMTLASGLLTLAVVAIYYFAVRRSTPGEAFWLRPVRGPALWTGAALAPSLYLLVTLIMTLVPEPLLEEYNSAASSLDDVGILAFLCVVIVSPIVEEVVFRGLIMTRLARVMAPWGAVVFSAAVFGLCHGQFLWCCYSFALAVVFGLIDMRARSIVPSILAHIAFNLIGQIFTTLNYFLPEGRWTAPVVMALFILGLLMIFVCRRDIAAMFRLSPVPEEDAPAPKAAPAGSAAFYEMSLEKERFSGGETYTYRDEVTEQDPWKD